MRSNSGHGVSAGLSSGVSVRARRALALALATGAVLVAGQTASATAYVLTSAGAIEVASNYTPVAVFNSTVADTFTIDNGLAGTLATNLQIYGVTGAKEYWVGNAGTGNTLTMTAGNFFIGYNGTTSVAGSYFVTGRIGSGTTDQSGGNITSTNVELGSFATGVGIHNLSGNAVLRSTTGAMKIGVAGTGTLNQSGTSTVTADSFLSVGGGAGTGVWNITGGNGTVVGALNIADVTASRGQINLNNATSILRAGQVFLGKTGTARGSLNLSAGNLIQTGGGDTIFGGNISTDTASVAVVTINGGSFNAVPAAGTGAGAANLQVGRYGSGQVNLSAGSMRVTNFGSVGRFANAFGLVDVSGTGTWTQSAQALLVGEAGIGNMTVRSGGLVNVAAGFNTIIGNEATADGNVSINTGGTWRTTRFSRTAGVGRLNLNGGLVQANADTTTFMTGLTAANVYAGGANIESNYNVTVGQSLIAPAGNGITSIPLTSGGTGYTVQPIVKITGGGGTGASAIANVTGGVITGFTILNPGTGYTSAPTVTIANANSGTVAAVVDTANIGFAANASGGLTKTGIGALTLTGANTYTGNTAINAGALAATVPAALANYSFPGFISVASGASLTVGVGGATNFQQADIDFILGGSTVAFAPGSSFGFDTSVGDFTYANNFGGSFGLAKTGANTLTMGGTTTYTGPTQVYAGALNVNNPAVLGTGAGATTVYNNGALVLANGIAVNGEALTLNGTSTFGGALVTALDAVASYNGTITLGTVGTPVTSARIGVSGTNSVLTVSGTINGGAAQGLDISTFGTGTSGVLNLQNVVANYTANTAIIRGNVVMDNFTIGATNPAAEIRLGTSASNENPGSLSINSTTNLANIDNLVIGAAAAAAANTNTTFNMTGGTVNARRFVVLGSTGAGTSISNISGGTINVHTNTTGAGDLEVSTFDTIKSTVNFSGATANIQNNGNLVLGGQGNSATGTFNQNGGLIAFFSDSGTTLGGTGLVNLGNNGTGVYVYNLSGGTLNTNRVTRTKTGATGSGTFNFNGGTLRAASNQTAFVAGLTAANVQNGGAVIDSNGFAVTVTQALLNGGTGGLTKQGAGTLTLSAVNTYVGGTAVSAGTLALDATGTIANTPSINVASGAVLDVTAKVGGLTFAGTLTGNGTVNGSVVETGSLSPGNSVGTLAFGNDLTISGTYLAEYDAATGLADRANVTGLLTLGAASVLNFTPINGAADDLAYVIASYGTLSGTFANEGSLPAGYSVDYNYLGTNTVAVVTVPEPTTLGLLALGGLGLLRRRRGN